MVPVLLFLITCVITARFFEKHKMKTAAVLYSVMFITVLSLLFFVVDVPLIKLAMNNLFGEAFYKAVNRSLSEAMSSSFCGINSVWAIALAFAVQLALILVQTTKKVVRCLIGKTQGIKFYKTYSKPIPPHCGLCISKKINLLYCRMLN